MRSRRPALLAAALVVLVAREAHGEEIIHLKSSSTVETEKGSRLTLPPGYFLDEETWAERDREMRRLQERETRLQAENQSLRASADQPAWFKIGVALVMGAVAGGAVIYSLK